MNTGFPSCDADAAGPVDGGPDGHPVDHARIERAVREILLAVGENPDREGLLETPARVARMYAEMFSGLHADPKVHLRKAFTEKYDEIVLVRDIAFNSVCEHHLLPFMGHAHIGYLPNGRVLGLSKLARVVEALSHRPQVQERMTEQIADLLVHDLGAKGVAVVDCSDVAKALQTYTSGAYTTALPTTGGLYTITSAAIAASATASCTLTFTPTGGTAVTATFTGIGIV